MKKILCFFDRITYEIRKIKFKCILIFSLLFFILGIISWIASGETNKMIILYIYPKAALNLGFMYMLWGISFLFCGGTLGGVLFGCEKFRRHKVYKIILYIIIMQLFSYVIHALFFRATAPFVALLSILIAILFCLLAIFDCFKIYSLWTICLCLHLLWLFYNFYICLAFIFLN